MKLSPDEYLCDWCGKSATPAQIAVVRETEEVCAFCRMGRDEPPRELPAGEIERRALEGARRNAALAKQGDVSNLFKE